MILGQNLSRFRMNALKQFFQNDPRLMIVHSRALSNFFISIIIYSFINRNGMYSETKTQNGPPDALPKGPFFMDSYRIMRSLYSLRRPHFQHSSIPTTAPTPACKN